MPVQIDLFQFINESYKMCKIALHQQDCPIKKLNCFPIYTTKKLYIKSNDATKVKSIILDIWKKYAITYIRGTDETNL